MARFKHIHHTSKYRLLSPEIYRHDIECPGIRSFCQVPSCKITLKYFIGYSWFFYHSGSWFGESSLLASFDYQIRTVPDLAGRIFSLLLVDSQPICPVYTSTFRMSLCVLCLISLLLGHLWTRKQLFTFCCHSNNI